MSIDRSKRISFEHVAELYDRVRPGYPQELIDDVLTLSGMPEDGRILEIGCGPGNATVSFAKRGYRILAIELGERLAALAAENCRPYPGVEIRNLAFEDWELEEKAFDLAISAEAFHWIPPEVGYPKVARALKDSGSAAFFWYAPVDPKTDWSREINEIYLETAPQVNNPDKAFDVEWLTEIIKDNFEKSGCFGKVTVRQYPGAETYTSEQYLDLLRTYSGLRDLDESARAELLTGIRNVVEQYGGSVTKPSLVALFHARVKR